MYNAVSCRSYSTGKVVLTFSSTACTDKTLESYRAKALAAAIKVHDSLWESGTLNYDMSQYEIARTYFQWLCDHCRYDNAAADDSASHLAYGAYGRTDLRYFGMSEEQSYQCHPWGTADKKK